MFNRKIFNVLGLYVGPTPATGFHLSSGLYSGTSLISQLSRIQSVTDDWQQSRVEVNQLGQLGALDRIIVAPPVAAVDFSWHSADFSNERLLGFDVSGVNPCITNFVNKSQDEKNYFIAAAPEGTDLYNYTGQSQTITVSNGAISSYRAEGGVGRLPTVSVKAEGLNWAATTGSILQLLKAVDRNSGTVVTNGMLFTLPVGTTGMSDAPVALRPGDITVNISNAALGLSISDLKIQNYNINIPLTREDLMKLGAFYAYSKEIRWPLTATASITARLGDIQTGDLSQMYCNDIPYNLTVLLHQPSCSGYGATQMSYSLQGFKVDGESNSMSIGSDSMVTLNYTSPISNATGSSAYGVFMSGNSW